MEYLEIIFFFCFAISFVLIFILVFISISLRIRLKNRLKKKSPNIWYRSPSFRDLMDFRILPLLFKLVISFGAKAKSQELLAKNYDIVSIEKFGDERVKIIFHRLIGLTSNLARLWLICVISLIILALIITLG